jgi:hypothetical protein
MYTGTTRGGGGQARAELSMWHHVGLSCTKWYGMTPKAVTPISLAQLLFVIEHRSLFLFLPLPVLSLRWLHWQFWSSLPYWKSVD